ncbi:hypothetical protein Tco_0907548 [Tanacetum coccineum]|uniref:Transposase, Ptta/En/Spm, transposase, Tnp1/En/Spm-like protein n=1 Tax=Tanacetum coccineum TaxID=301880 RepID=A0ABQ5CLS4_9ASTR
MEKDSEIYKGKKERVKSIALKAKKESSDDETLTFRSDEEEYAMALRKFKKSFRRKGKIVRQPREEKKSFRLHGTRNKKLLLGVLEVIAKMSDNDSSLDDDSMQIVYNNLCEISLKSLTKNKILKTKREVLERIFFELNEKIKKLEINKEIAIGCESCQQLRLENAKLKETQVKFIKFDQSANSLNEMFNVQKSPNNKEGLGFGKNEASTSGTKQVHFVKSTVVLPGNGSIIKADGSTIHGSVNQPKQGRKSFKPTYVCLRIGLELDEWIKDSGYSKHMTGNKSLFSTYRGKKRAILEMSALSTTIEIPNGWHQGRNFLQSFGGREGSYDLMLEQIDVPGILHLQGRLFESRVCLLLVCRDDIGSREFTIYVMMKGCYVWTVRYVANTEESMTPLPE